MDITKAIWLLSFPWFLLCHGKATEDAKSACDSAPCQNGAQCIDVTYPGGPLAFKCSCKEGYEGLTCQKRIDLCADEPCQNGGVCSQRGEHYHCACPESYHGKNCENSAAKKDPCIEKPCGPHGVCEVVNGQASCECLQGHSGSKCEISEADNQVKTAPTFVEDEEEWVIKDILIAMLFFVVLFAAILFFICCHCYRVWNQRSALKAVQEAQKAAGKDPGPVVGWVDLSNQMCYDFFCCCFPRPEKSAQLGDRCFADPDNITGVIVPLKDYNNFIRQGYMNTVCYRENPMDKVKIDLMAPECEPMRGQPCPSHYCYEPGKYPTTHEDSTYPINMSVKTRDEGKMPPVCTRDRLVPIAQGIPPCQHQMEPERPGGTMDIYSDGQQNMRRDTMWPRSDTMMASRGTDSMMTVASAAPQLSYSNLNVNKEPPYSQYRRNPMSGQSADRRKISRADLYAQHGKRFAPRNVWTQPKYVDHDVNQGCSQSTNQNHIQPEMDTYPVPMYNGLSHEQVRPDFYSNGLYPIPQAPPYPWLPPPYTYPYPFLYPPQNNNQDNSCSEVSSTQATPRDKVDTRKSSDRNSSPHATPQQKLSHGSVKGQAMGRRQNVRNILGGESKMDNLQFIDDADGETDPMLVDISEDDGRSQYVDTDTDDETLDRVDDDGYGSTNRLSESEVGGRMRNYQSHREYSEDSSRNSAPRKQKQRTQKCNKLSPRSPQQCNMHNSKLRRFKLNERPLDSCKSPICNSEHTEGDSHNSTSEDEKEDYLGLNEPDAVQNNANRTRHDSYRVPQQQLQDGGHGPNKLTRRGDLWGGQVSKCSTSQKYVLKGDDIQLLKPVPKSERQCLTAAPKKVKGILKNNSHGGNYNRSASSFSVRKIKDIATSRFNGRRRYLRQRESDEIE